VVCGEPLPSDVCPQDADREGQVVAMEKTSKRRDLLKGTLAAAAGGALALSLEEQALAAADPSVSTESAAEPAADLLPTGKIGKVNVTRLICGGNLISGFAHSRDLIYVSAMLKHYFTDEKVWETLHICEQAGINTALLRNDDQVIRILDEYWKKRGGKIQWLAQVYPKEGDTETDIKRAVDNGAVACYIQGGIGDRWVKADRVDLLEKSLKVIRDAGVPGGVGGHVLDVPMAVEAAGLEPDFYMKTFHRPDYWSYTKEGKHDNSWCATPEETAKFMQEVKRPWIAFKTLAAGAIHPRAGFRYVFENGADFACVGMFDFQVREDAAIARKVLSGKLKRQRPWQA